VTEITVCNLLLSARHCSLPGPQGHSPLMPPLTNCSVSPLCQQRGHGVDPGLDWKCVYPHPTPTPRQEAGGMFGIRSLRAGLQLASTCSFSPPFFCPPKHNHTAAYNHRILCNINSVCYAGHITTVRAEEAYRYSITNRGINECWAPAIRRALSQNNLHPARSDARSTLLTPDTCARCVVFVRAVVVVYVHVRESWGQQLRECANMSVSECVGL
jgi:hypothetical protein